MRTKKLLSILALMLTMVGTGASALTMVMQYTGYASLPGTNAAGLKAACEIVSIVIE